MARTTAAHLDPSKMEQVNGLIMPKFAPKPTRWSFGENAEWPSGRSVSNCRQNDTMPELQKISSVNYEVEMAYRRRKNRIFHINMLRQWNPLCVLSLLAKEVTA